MRTMNRATKVAVVLIVAAGLSTMVYGIPEHASHAAKIAPAVSLTTEQTQGCQTPIPPNTLADSVTTECPAGTHVTGGGFQLGPFLQVTASFREGRVSTNGWVATINNPTSNTGELTVVAECDTAIASLSPTEP